MSAGSDWRPGGGNTRLRPADVRHAIESGVNYLNWCGHVDGLSRAIAELGKERERVVVAWQLQSASAREATDELDRALEALRTDYIDIVTFYYAESVAEWRTLIADDGAYGAMQKAKAAGKVRLLGMTSHQRSFAVAVALGAHGPDRTERPLNMLMIRYNAAHRRAEVDVFPMIDREGIPVVAFTCMRWGALIAPTPDDPPGFCVPPARDWYRFVLANRSVAVALMAPNGRRELEENLRLLDDWRAPTPAELADLRAHGARVRRHAGRFP